MSEDTSLRLDDLPEVVELFPHHGNILMPSVQLPIPFGSPMHALPLLTGMAKKQKFIGLVQPMQRVQNIEPYFDVDNTEDPESFINFLHSEDTQPSIHFFKTGTLAKVVDILKGDFDREPVALLRGICRFSIKTIIKKKEDATYQAHVDYTHFITDLENSDAFHFDRSKLLKKLGDYLYSKGVHTDLDVLNNVSDEQFLHAVCMALPLRANEKQAFLEKCHAEDQLDILHKLVDMHNERPPSHHIH
jgi:hypothetical protein